MSWQRRTGAVLVAAGSLLLAVAVVPTVYGRVMAHVAVAEFRAAGGAHSLWDSARIRAHQRSLGVAMTPPEAVLRVPRLGLEAPVFEGTGDLEMNRGLGHIAGTAMPGAAGNVAIAGHRDGFFRPLKDVRVGDVIEVQRRGSTAAQTDRYVVERTTIISPADAAVLQPTSVRTLTLVTCYPFYFVGAAPQRFIVQARQVFDEASTQASVARPPAARGEASQFQSPQTMSPSVSQTIPQSIPGDE
jgi:sortase A